MMGELEKQIKVVAEARQKSATLKEVKRLAYTKFEELNKDLLLSVVAAEKRTWDTEVELRELTLQAYAETGMKVPALGVGIREKTVLTYDDKVAFDWAKAHKMALKLDSKAFEKIAKADTPDFVKITTEATATIATELEVK